MLFRKTSSLALIRLHAREELLQSIASAFKRTHWHSAAIVNGIGRLKNVKLGYLHKGKYLQKKFAQPQELLCLQGSVCYSAKREVVVHAHASLSDRKSECVGGHVISGVVDVTCEIFLLNSSALHFLRREEPSGLKGISIV